MDKPLVYPNIDIRGTRPNQFVDKPEDERSVLKLSHHVREVSRNTHKGPGEYTIHVKRGDSDTRQSVYDIRNLGMWDPDEQEKNGAVAVRTVYDYFKEKNLLSSCPDLKDGYAIAKKGVVMFRRRFGKNVAVLLFGSAEEGHGVPFLFVREDKVKVGWLRMDHTIVSINPIFRVLRFE